jgi:uncharacterized protein (DUF1778 family)
MFNLKRPCTKCPFRTDVKPFIRTDRAEEIANSLARDNWFQCHETIEHNDEGGYKRSKGEQHCAGAAITLLKMGRPNQLMRIGMRTGWNPDTMDMTAPVYKSLGSFVVAVAKSNKTSRLPAGLTSGNRSRTFKSRSHTNSQETHDMFQDKDSHRVNLRLKPDESKQLEKAAKVNGEKPSSFAKRVTLEAAAKLAGPVVKKSVKKLVKKTVAKKVAPKKVVPVKAAVKPPKKAKRKSVAHA